MTRLLPTLSRRALPLMLAAALGLAGLGPAPARADDDLRRFLAGAAGLVLLYGILESGRRGQAAPPQYVPPTRAHPPAHARPHRPGLLPAACAVEVAGGRHGTQLFGANCLQRNGIDLRRLPQHCAVTLRAQRGQRNAYDGRCLQRAGWQVTRVHPGRPGHAPRPHRPQHGTPWR